MDPIKRMVIIVVIIIVFGVVALFGIYYSMKKLQVSARTVTSQEEAITEKETAPEQKFEAEATSEPAKMREEAPASAIPESEKLGEWSEKKTDIISEEDLLKYLKVKDTVFSAYGKKKGHADLMLNQQVKWGPEEIKIHMFLLADMRIQKRVGLRDSDLKESRYNYISSAIMEWALRTKNLPYQKKYKGDDSFYTNKLSQIAACQENDALFEKHKEEIAKTFMGDFELVDY